MDYRAEYEALCRKIAGGTFKEVDREQMQQRGADLLKRDAVAAKAALEAAKAVALPPSEEKPKGRRTGSDE